MWPYPGCALLKTWNHNCRLSGETGTVCFWKQWGVLSPDFPVHSRMFLWALEFWDTMAALPLPCRDVAASTLTPGRNFPAHEGSRPAPSVPGAEGELGMLCASRCSLDFLMNSPHQLPSQSPAGTRQDSNPQPQGCLCQTVHRASHTAEQINHIPIHQSHTHLETKMQNQLFAVNI